MIKTAKQLGQEAAHMYLEKYAWANLALGAARATGPALARLFGQRAGMTMGQRAMGAFGSVGGQATMMAPSVIDRAREIKNMGGAPQGVARPPM